MDFAGRTVLNGNTEPTTLMLSMIPMSFGRSTAVNLQLLVQCVCLQYGITFDRVVSAVSDGASNCIKVSICSFTRIHSCTQWQRLLSVFGEWCVVHKGHLVAIDGLAALPAVAELDDVCAQLQSIQFVRMMHSIRNQNMNQFGAIRLLHIQKVNYFIVFCLCFQNFMNIQPNTTRWRSHAMAWLKIYEMWPLIRAAWTALGLYASTRLPEQTEIGAMLALMQPLNDLTLFVSAKNSVGLPNIICLFAVQLTPVMPTGGSYTASTLSSPFAEHSQRNGCCRSCSNDNNATRARCYVYAVVPTFCTDLLRRHGPEQYEPVRITF